MNIILLLVVLVSVSGLFPMMRSKQFIKLFKNDDEYESMVQRVYRQITTVDADAKITIATSKRLRAIKNQLRRRFHLCEPASRRRSRPLHWQQLIPPNWALRGWLLLSARLTYVDNTYYEAVKTCRNWQSRAVQI